MLKKIFITPLLLIIYSLSLTNPAHAENKSFITISYPIRGSEFWPLDSEKETPYQNFRFYLDQQQEFQLPATFLLRYDALLDTQITTTARDFPDNLEAGLFLEITPQLASAAGVTYHQSSTWSAATSVFISGYNPEDRLRLIDTTVSQFQKTLGATPTSVGAWHIDAASASYLRQKYGVTTILICADQYSTDHYQLWGGWWGVPYYPSRYHILQPAQSLQNKLDLVVTHWATRDPVNGYGPTAAEASLYSVQPNDYLKLGLDTHYFLKLLDIYTQTPDNPFGYLNIGLENDYSTRAFGPEFTNQLQIVKDQTAAGQLQTLTLSQFSAWYRQTFPQLSPTHTLKVTDPLDSDRTAVWQMTPQYRLGLITTPDRTLLRDFRLYNEDFAEPFLSAPNLSPNLYLSVPAHTDTVLNSDKLQPVSESQINQLEHLPIPKLPYSTNLILLASCFLLLTSLIWFFFRKNKPLALILTLGSLTLSLPMIKSGILYEYGMGFWGPNGHDAIWHLALIEHFSRHFNLDSPILTGAQLTNYHFLFDIAVALVHRITTIPNLTLYFQILPPLMALGLGFSVYKFVFNWTRLATDNRHFYPERSRRAEATINQPSLKVDEESPSIINLKLSNMPQTAALLSLVFLYFGGSAGWLVNLLRGQSIFNNSESLFWASQSISLLINPPLALSLILLFTGLNLLQKLSTPSSQSNSGVGGTGGRDPVSAHPEQGQRGALTGRKPETGPTPLPLKLKTLTSALLFGFLIQAKSYAAVITLPALFVFSLLTTYNLKPKTALRFVQNWWQNLSTKIFLSASLITTLLFLLFSRSASGLMQFSPLWFPHTMLAFADRLHWPQLANARTAYLATGNWPKLLLTEALALTLFLFGNLWLRSLGIIEALRNLRQLKKLTPITAFLLTATLCSLLFTLLFIQKGNPWNTIQFFYYTQIFMGIFTAALIAQWTKPTKSKLILVTCYLLLVGLNIPTTVGTLTQYLPHRAPSRISYSELLALDFLKNQPEGTVLTQPFLEASRNLYPPPKPLWSYETTAYVSALSGQPTFATDYMNLEITGYHWQEPHNQALRFFRAPDTAWAKQFLTDNHIRYLYLVRDHPLLDTFTPPDYLETLFTTDEVIIYQVNL
jgi:hypothetical protein